MFDFIPNGLSLVVSLLLPTFLTYKALQTLPEPSASSPSAASAATNDFLSFIHNVNAYANNQNTPASAQPNPVALLRPWLTYWITLALVNAALGFVSPFTAFIPLFAWLRLMLHVYLLVPGTADRLYQTRIQPFLRQHEGEIEDFISQSHDSLKGQVLDAINKLLDIVRSLGLGGRASTSSGAQSQSPDHNMTYVQSMLARFTVASSAQAARSSAPPSSSSRSPSSSNTPADPIEALAATSKVVKDFYGKLKTDASAPDPRSPSSGSSSATHHGQSGAFRRSRSELEFETINQEDAMGSSGVASGSAGTPSGSGWGEWLFGSGGGGSGSSDARRADKARSSGHSSGSGRSRRKGD